MTPTTANERLKKRRLAQDSMSLDTAAYRVRDLMGEGRAPSKDTIRRMELAPSKKDSIPEEKWNSEVVLALSLVYRCGGIEELSEVAAAGLQNLLTMAAGDGSTPR